MRLEPNAEADLTNLAAVIRMFSPDENLAAIRPVGPTRLIGSADIGPCFNKRSKGADRPLRAPELARLVMLAQGIDLGDQGRLLSISCGLQAVLGKLEVRGFVSITGKLRRLPASSRLPSG